jgi:putative FmdB family regulatory protein
MPLYEYRCDACGHECECLQSVREPELTICPRCSQPKLHRVVSRVSFRLKGGGWYETDFKKEGRRNVLDDGSGADKSPPAEGSPRPVQGAEGGTGKTAEGTPKPGAEAPKSAPPPSTKGATSGP